MPVYRFSSLFDGQAIRFNPFIDDLLFDQSIISAADVRVLDEGAHTRIRVISGTYAGKDVLLLNVEAQQLATSNVAFANGSRLLFGDDSTSFGDEAANHLTGTAGRDHLAGFGGDDTLDGGARADYMNGGAGNDTYIVTSGDVLTDSAGMDTVLSSVSWNLAVGFENLTLTGSATSGNGNSGNNTIIGNAANNFISGREGNDSMSGGAGNDTFIMSNGAGASYGQDSIDGGTGVDTLDFGANARSAITADFSSASVTGGGTGGAGSATIFGVENLNASAHNDRVVGNFANNFFFGYDGNDTLVGAEGHDRLEGGAGDDWLYGNFSFAVSNTGAGNDVLTGGAGRDNFVFNDNPNPFIASPLATADRITDFSSGNDTLVFDDNVFPGVGGPGRFSFNDERFYASSGATSGHDETDRVIYDTSAGRLYYDPDGSGGVAAQLIATLDGRPMVASTDISVV